MGLPGLNTLVLIEKFHNPSRFAPPRYIQYCQGLFGFHGIQWGEVRIYHIFHYVYDHSLQCSYRLEDSSKHKLDNDQELSTHLKRRPSKQRRVISLER